MQLIAFVLLFISTTDKTWASSHRRCGGEISLDQEPTGRINLTLPGLRTDTDSLNPMKRESRTTLQLHICTWTIDVPTGKTVLLKPEWLESGLSILVQCAMKEKKQALESGTVTVLSGCDGNKATLTWAKDGHSSNVVGLTYYVQEDERNSTDGRLTHRPDLDLTGWTQTGTSFTSAAPIGREIVKGTQRGRGHPCEGLESSSDARCPSRGTSQDPLLVRQTSAPQGLSVAGSADRETLPLPEEKPNNEADTSGAAHLTDAPMAARERTHPYFETEFNTHIKSEYATKEAPPAQTETAVSFHSMFLPDMQKYKSSQTPKQAYKHTTSHTEQSASSFPRLTASAEELPSQSTGESVTVISKGVSREKSDHPWRSLRNTDRLSSDFASSSPTTASSNPPRRVSLSFRAYTDPTSVPESFSISHGPSGTHSPIPHASDVNAAPGTTDATIHPNSSRNDLFLSTASDAIVQTSSMELLEKTQEIDVLVSSERQTNAELSTDRLSDFPESSSSFIIQAANNDAESTQRNILTAETTMDTASFPSDGGIDDGEAFFTTQAPLIISDETQNRETTKETYTLHPVHTKLNDNLPTNSPNPLLVSSPSVSPHTLQANTHPPDSSHTTLFLSVTDSTKHQTFVDLKSTATPLQTSHIPQPGSHLSLSASAELTTSRKQRHNSETTTSSVVSFTRSDQGKMEETENLGEEHWQWTLGNTTSHTPMGTHVLQTTPPLWKESHSVRTASPATSTLIWTSAENPKFYIMPDQPVVVKVEHIELLLQIVVEESHPAFTDGLEEETAAWVEPYLQRAPGYSRMLGVMSSGHAVQSLVLFRTSEALQWLSMSGPNSLLERTGLAQALREGRTFTSSRIINITVGGSQGEVCDWLLQCPAGYKCRSQLGGANYSCSSVCHFDHCHHHGICTHHPTQAPVCRCLAGDDFWYMGRRCDVRMTRARLVGACLAVLVIIVTVIGGLAFVAVRRYRAILIQAKVDQTRSRIHGHSTPSVTETYYRRFNHFDELSGRFWLRSWAGSADSLDNPGFTRSNDLLHLRALDRPCCYHDDTLSLASTCPSHGTHINTIYPNSSQYGWRGSEMSMGDGVLDSGKASDLSVCSWPVEPIHWTPFPLLQQLAAHRTPTVRVSRPRSYCEGMELVDLGRSWTA